MPGWPTSLPAGAFLAALSMALDHALVEDGHAFFDQFGQFRLGLRRNFVECAAVSHSASALDSASLLRSATRLAVVFTRNGLGVGRLVFQCLFCQFQIQAEQTFGAFERDLAPCALLFRSGWWPVR